MRTKNSRARIDLDFKSGNVDFTCGTRRVTGDFALSIKNRRRLFSIIVPENTKALVILIAIKTQHSVERFDFSQGSSFFDIVQVNETLGIEVNTEKLIEVLDIILPRGPKSIFDVVWINHGVYMPNCTVTKL